MIIIGIVSSRAIAFLTSVMTCSPPIIFVG
jgi:hypothetical protein